MGETPPPAPGNRPSAGVTHFLSSTYAMVCDSSIDDIISWSEDGRSFIVHSVEGLESILSKHFRHQRLSSFVRQMNMYGFHKIRSTGRLEFQHDLFLRDQPHLLDSIKRKKSTKGRGEDTTPTARRESVARSRRRGGLTVDVKCTRSWRKRRGSSSGDYDPPAKRRCGPGGVPLDADPDVQDSEGYSDEELSSPDEQRHSRGGSQAPMPQSPVPFRPPHGLPCTPRGFPNTVPSPRLGAIPLKEDGKNEKNVFCGKCGNVFTSHSAEYCTGCGEVRGTLAGRHPMYMIGRERSATPSMSKPLTPLGACSPNGLMLRTRNRSPSAPSAAAPTAAVGLLRGEPPASAALALASLCEQKPFEAKPFAAPAPACAGTPTAANPNASPTFQAPAARQRLGSVPHVLFATPSATVSAAPSSTTPPAGASPTRLAPASPTRHGASAAVAALVSPEPSAVVSALHAPPREPAAHPPASGCAPMECEAQRHPASRQPEIADTNPPASRVSPPLRPSGHSPPAVKIPSSPSLAAVAYCLYPSAQPAGVSSPSLRSAPLAAEASPSLRPALFDVRECSSYANGCAPGGSESDAHCLDKPQRVSPAESTATSTTSTSAPGRASSPTRSDGSSNPFSPVAGVSKPFGGDWSAPVAT